MTIRQKRACDLAIRILQDQASAEQLNDLDWALLMLAADMNCVSIPPHKVAARVIVAFRQGTGYFRREGDAQLAPDSAHPA